MKHIVQDLRRSAHMLTPDLAQWVFTQEFENAVLVAETENSVKAILLIELLNEISLDPLSGTSPDAFYTRHLGSVGFNARLNRWTSFIGVFELSEPKESALIASVISAITANLDSKMFKAARLHRRLDKRYSRRYKIAAEHAYAEYTAYLSKCVLPNSESDRSRASEVRDQKLAQQLALFTSRTQRVSQVSGSLFTSSYTESLTSFLARHLMAAVSSGTTFTRTQTEFV